MRLLFMWVWMCVGASTMAAPKPGAPGQQSLSPPLPSPPTPGEGLFATIQKLMDKVQELEQLQNRDRTKIRRLERRGRDCREGLAKVQADMIQVQLGSKETASRLAKLEDDGSDVSLEVLGLRHKHDALKTLVQRMRSNHSNEQVTNGSATTIAVTELDDVRERLSRLEEEKTRMGTQVQRLSSTVHRLHGWQDTADIFLEQLRQGVNLVSNHLAHHVLDPFRHVTPPFYPPGIHPHGPGTHPHNQAAHTPTEGTLLQPDDTTSIPQSVSSQPTEDSSPNAQVTASNASDASLPMQSTPSPSATLTTQADSEGITANPPGTHRTPSESPLYPFGEPLEESEDLDAEYAAAVAADRKGEGMDIIDYTGLGLDLTATSGADYEATDYGKTDYGLLDYGAGSSTPDYGDYDSSYGTIPGGLPGRGGMPGSIPVNIPQRPAVPATAGTTPGSLEVEDVGSGEADLPVGPPPAIVCPTWRGLRADNSSLYLNVSHLEERLHIVERELRGKLDADLHREAEVKVREMIKVKSESLADEVNRQKKVIQEFDDTISKMDRKLQAVEERVATLRVGGVMRQLQETFLNFSQHVLTLEQWQTASSSLLNATHTNQQQVARLTAMIVNATNRMAQVEWQTTDQQLLTEQQYNVLRTHVIRLNNSLQDLREHVQNMQRIHNRPGNPPLALRGVLRGGGSGGGGGGSVGSGGEVYVSSKLDDLTLQLVYNENRIAGLESKLYNKTLSECKKVNDDMYRESRLSRLEGEVNALNRKSSALQDTVNRAESALYRSLTLTRNHTSAIADLSVRMSQCELYTPQIQLLRQEVTNLLEQVPVDCQTYRDRGHVDTGIYVIYPKGALQSVRVECVMIGKEGWTVLQHRYDGSESFARSWAEYAVGFGQAEQEHWLGNEFLHLITRRRNYTLRVEMTDIFGGKWLAKYNHFRVGPKGDNYRLEISGFHGNATDGLNYTDGMAFSTPDRDNDYSSAQCAAYHLAGWWYRHCQYSNLNGRFDTGIIWFHTRWQDWIHLRHTRMMIRPAISPSPSSTSHVDAATEDKEGKK